MCAALVETGKFDNVELIYLLRGHSFMPYDQNFGVTKRLLKKYDRIYDVHTYTEIIAKSSSASKFTVKEITTDDILNFKDWWPEHYKKIVTSEDQCKKKFGISEFHHFIFDKGKPGTVVANNNYINSLVKSKFKILRQTNKKREVKFSAIKAYPAGKVPILETKIKDMKLLIRYVGKNLGFYEAIIHNWPTKQSKKRRDQQH